MNELQVFINLAISITIKNNTMKRTPFILLIFLFISSISFSQNMQKGFTYLETGEYSSAETFFSKVLKDFPNNKTAKLCYGRAVGLNGDAPKAVAIFTELAKKHPTDFEIKLNYAEALLWNKKYEQAETYYENLILENDQSFPGLLGYANTLSNLKNYTKALIYVNKALLVLPGNPNALVSKKYMQLGYADQLVKKQEYDKAIDLLKKNFLLFKGDKETLKNLVNAYTITKKYELAKDTYKTLATSKKDSIASLNGLALIAHLQDKNKLALAISTEALTKVKAIQDTLLKNKTDERYTQALIWNKKYKKAHILISELEKENANRNWVLALRATLNIYKSDFKNTLKNYDQILKNDKSSFDGNLGKANALKASGKYLDAYQAAETTLVYYKDQKDAVNFIKKLDQKFTPSAVSKTAYSFDNGDNKAVTSKITIDFPLSTKFKLTANYGYRTTENKVTKNNANAHNFQVGFAHQWHPNVIFNTAIGTSSTKTESKNYGQFLADVYFNIKPFKLQTLDIGYKREMESFNADLLEKEIVKNNFYANYNVSTNFNLGWFTQYFYTSQNDDNKRNLLFTSLYYNILTKPILKTGINFQAITFKNQVATIYFSPKKFKAYEIFINLLKDENSNKVAAWFYDLNAATGFQFIEDDEKQNTYRIQAKLGYKFSDRFLANIYGTRSNIASATAAGFTFNEIGLRMKWYFMKKPAFSRK